MNKKKDVCGITVPTEVGFVEDTLKILEKWGADAVRDCDGTAMPEEIIQAGYKVYSTYFVARGDNEWAKKHPEESTHFYLMSERVTAFEIPFQISITKGYLTEQILPDYDYDPKKWWEVIDRTTGNVVSPEDWSFEAKDHTVTVKRGESCHEYTVNFLAKSIWDSTQMYNYITNHWTREKDMPFDARCDATNQYVVDRMRNYLAAHPDTDVVRFTTFFYHFALLFNSDKKEKFVDWFGYSGSVSPKALDEFEKEYGYRLRPEDIVDEGYYNSPFRIPSKAYLDYMDFTQRFVAQTAKRLVDEVHKAGKEAMMFLGDNWIGTEPYGKYFKDIDLDAVVGSVGGGVTVRMLSEIPNVRYTEGRFLPYFFPDTFYEGGRPTDELNKNWLTARRALMRKPVDRIGYGGYLSLAAKFPDFVARVSQICDEFRGIYKHVKGKKPYSGVKVGILNCWGKLRSWQCYMVAHELWYREIYSYQGILEALSGLSADVEFLSFDDIKNTGIPKDIDVIINAGSAGTAFSGGANWVDSKVISTVRKWVAGGGGLIGIGDPTAYLNGGRFFQLADILGVDKELGFTLSTDKYNITPNKGHFILEDVKESIDYGESVKDIYALDGSEVLDIDLSKSIERNVNVGEVKMAANQYGKGRGFYMAGLPYSKQNARILFRALFYAAGKEKEMTKAFSSNPEVECNYYPEDKSYALVNNSNEKQTTEFYDINGKKKVITLEAMEIKWI